MKVMIKIHLSTLPPPVEQALSQLLAGQEGVVLTESDPDVIISGAPVAGAGRPVLALSFETPRRLGEVLAQIGRMIAQPVLYIGDIVLGTGVFRPQEKLWAPESGAAVPLTDREVDVLAYLARHGDAPVSREALLRDVWRYQDGIDTHTLETHIYRLRQKIELSADAPQLLLTVDGGYRLQRA